MSSFMVHVFILFYIRSVLGINICFTHSEICFLFYTVISLPQSRLFNFLYSECQSRAPQASKCTPVAKIIIFLFVCFFHFHCQQLSTAKHWPYHVPHGREGLSWWFLPWRSQPFSCWARLRNEHGWTECLHVCCQKKRLHLYLRDYHLQRVVSVCCRQQHSTSLCVCVCVFSAVSSSA